ncbi:hypothetical protein HY440_02520 [Candidatus Microgenomates bacterium]|nr:hypothetical protein [Candidatus Microgenomates bacterium]
MSCDRFTKVYLCETGDVMVDPRVSRVFDSQKTPGRWTAAVRNSFHLELDYRVPFDTPCPIHKVHHRWGIFTLMTAAAAPFPDNTAATKEAAFIRPNRNFIPNFYLRQLTLRPAPEKS